MSNSTIVEKQTKGQIRRSSNLTNEIKDKR